MEKSNTESTAVIEIKEKPLEFNIEYVLSRIDMIISDNAHVHDGISTIKELEVNNSTNGGFGDQAKGEAICNIVTSRETTNQQLIHLLEKMYDDLKPKKKEIDSLMKFTFLKDKLKAEEFNEDEYSSSAIEMLKQYIQTHL